MQFRAAQDALVVGAARRVAHTSILCWCLLDSRTMAPPDSLPGDIVRSILHIARHHSPQQRRSRARSRIGEQMLVVRRWCGPLLVVGEVRTRGTARDGSGPGTKTSCSLWAVARPMTVEGTAVALVMVAGRA